MKPFKAYDVRGIYPEELNEELAYNIGRAFILYTKAKEVLLAEDSRLSSPPLKAAMIRGLLEQGANVIDMGLATTPMLRYMQLEEGIETALQITASHNPKEYGGIKFFDTKNNSYNGTYGLPEIEALARAGTFPDATLGTITKKNYLEIYVNLIAKKITTDLTDLYVVVDASNGPAGTICEPLFNKLGIQYAELNFAPDGNFPGHDPNPIKKSSQEQARRKVLEIGADFGCIFDADADRIFFVNEQGQTIEPELIAAAIATHLLKTNPGDSVLYDCFSSHVVKDAVEKAGGKAIIYRTGAAFICEYARENNLLFCAESSSHYMHRAVHHIDHGLFTLLEVMALVAQEQKPLSEIIKPFDIYEDSGQLKVEVDDAKKTMNLLLAHYKDNNPNTIDGIIVEYDDASWFIVRPSNTEPLLRVRMQAKNKERIAEIRKELESVVGKDFLEV